MELRVLGPIELRTGGVQADIGPARQRCVLGALLIDAGRPVPPESLVDRIWGDDPPDGVRNVVHTYVARLRRAFAAAPTRPSEQIELVRSPAGYLVSTDLDAVDLVRFRRLSERAEQAGVGDRERSALLRQALLLWRGDALAGMQSDWAVRVRQALRRSHQEVLGRWADAEIRLGRPDAVLTDLRSALLADPSSEQLCRRLMLALHLQGRRTDALECYRSTRTLIARELGMDPSERLQRLHESILRDDTPGPAAPSEPRGAGPLRILARSRPDPVVPQMLPLDLPGFTGRERELDVIRRTLTGPTDGGPPPAVLVVGGVGVGKTALAVHAAHREEPGFPDGRLYASLGACGDRPADPHAVQGRLLHALGADPDRIPADPGERTAAYRSALAGRRLLLTLDDAAGDDQVRPLLPGTADTAVLITGRRRLGALPGARLVRPAGLTHEQSVQFLARALGAGRVDREPAAAAAIARYCAGLPLALRAAAARLTTRSHWSLHHYAERLGDEARRLDELTHSSLSVRARFTASYDALPDDARETLRSLAGLAAPEFDARLACPVLGKDAAAVEDVCDRLVEAHFLTVAESPVAGPATRYRLDGLQRSFAHGLRAGRAG